MSDIMLLGVLRMPMDPATVGPIEIMQYVARGQEAADRIEADEVKIRSLQDHVARLEGALAERVGDPQKAKTLIDNLRRQANIA